MKKSDVVLNVLVCVLLVNLGLLAGGWPPFGPPERPEPAPSVNPQLVVANPARQLGWQLDTAQDGAVLRVTDPAGQKTIIRRELEEGKRLRRLVKELPGGGKVVHEFDEFGHRTTLQDASGTTRYEYNKDNRLEKVLREGRPTLTYAYDAQGRVRSLAVGDNWKVSYAYDFLGRLDKIETPAGAITYTYRTDIGTVERRLPNGVRTVWQHQPGGKLESIIHAGPDNKLLARYTYDRRPDGLIREVKEWAPQGERVLEYEYDKTQRLIGVKDSRGEPVTYRYDKFGNRTEAVAGGKTVASQHDWAGRLKSHRGKDCTHDGLGNVTTYEGPRGGMALKYTPEGRVQAVQAGPAKVEYAHDGDGLLIARTVGGRTTSFVPDVQSGIWRPLLADNGGEQTFYVWGGDTPLAAVTGGKVRFFLHNHLGSVRLHVDADGSAVESPDYSAFGVPQGAAGPGGLRPGFTGLFYDADAGLYLTRARAYDPDLGRFLQRDPLHRTPMGEQKDFSAYAYCGGDPVNFLDRDGAQSQSWRQQWLVSESLRPMSWEGAYPPFAYYGEWCGGDRAPAESGFYPRPIDPVDRCCMIHDIQLKLARNDDRSLGFSSVDPRIVSINQQLADCLRRARDDPSTYLAGRFFATYATPLFQGMAGVEGLGVNVRQWFSSPGTSPPSSSPLPTSFPNWPSQPPFPDLYPIWRAPSPSSRQDSNSGSSGGRLTMDESVPKGGLRGASGKVGGIALRGAGKALPPLGCLRGLAVDANGRLVLITQDKGDVRLPPLRLDDLVTVFRCVYEHGEAPWVSIESDPINRPPTADVVHGKGTADTYVGWVLYEADRIMKCYSLGADSYTKQPIQSNVPGYEALLDLHYALAGSDNESNRYWIVPAAVRRLRSDDRRLTLLDVPLQLETERSVIKDGKKIVLKGTKSKTALAYCAWFTKHYGELAKEVYLQPPPESEIKEPVPVFAELQRVALMAALAESLRDQGVPMPAWMLDHPVRAVPVRKKTPRLSLQNERKVNGRVYRLSQYGGVTLSAPPKAIESVESAPEAVQLAPAVRAAVARAPSWQPVSFHHNGQTYRAVALPGNDTQGLGAAELDAADLSVPVPGGQAVRLERSFNSFYDPKGELGQGWTLDLPRLHKQRLVTKRTEGMSYSRWVYQMTSPLMTHADSFTEEQFVPEVHGKLLAPRASRQLYGLTYTRQELPMLLFRDGRAWEFDKAGRLAASFRGPFRQLYHYDGQGRLERIEGWYGATKRAEIELEYDARGRVRAARGSDGTRADYAYDPAGRLVRAKAPGGVTAYGYRDGQVSRVTHNGKLMRELFYTADGRLRRERRPDGSVWVHTDTPGKDGLASTARREGDKGPADATVYDAALRPLKRTLANGTSLRWRYPEGGDEELTVTTADGRRWTQTTAPNGARQVREQLPGGGEAVTDTDGAGRLTGVRLNGRKVLSRSWRPDGQPESVRTEDADLIFRYAADRTPQGFLLGGHKGEKGYTNWLQLTCDAEGRPRELADHYGQKIEVRYDEQGRPTGWKERRGEVEVKRATDGRPEEVTTSWGEGYKAVYGSDGLPRRLELTQEGGGMVVELNGGWPTAVKNFDGAVQRIRYYTGGPHKGRIREVRTPNDVVLTYRYDAQGRLVEVDCGGAYRVVYRYDARGRLSGFAEEAVP
jgi:RHS repeat-associated protein